MLHNLFHFDISPANLTVRVVAVFFFVLIILRLGGKRELGQMSATEFVALLLVSNAVQNAMNGGDNSLGAGLFLAGILIFLSWCISVLTYHSKKMSLLFEGSPTLLIHRGHIVASNLRKERIRTEELRSMLRKQGIHHINDVHSAVFEADATLSVIRNSDLEAKVADGIPLPKTEGAGHEGQTPFSKS